MVKYVKVAKNVVCVDCGVCCRFMEVPRNKMPRCAILLLIFNLEDLCLDNFVRVWEGVNFLDK